MGRLESVLWALGVGASGGSDQPASPPPMLSRSSRIADIIEQDIATRAADFRVVDALRMPSVRRAVDLIQTVGASLEPLVIRGDRLLDTPRIIERPDPFRSGYDFLALTLRSLLEEGDAYWRIGEGYAIVLDPADVQAEWKDDRKLQVHYTVRGEEVRLDTDIKHLRIGQRPSDAKGSSPIKECLETLAILWAQETFAQTYFASNGTPHTVLSTDQTMTAEQAKLLRDAYIAARAQSGVATLSSGFSAEYTSADPERAQLTESRDYARTVVAMLLGIPGPLMLTNGGGTNLTYTNVSQLVTSLARQTVLPMYMRPIEQALTELLPRGQRVEFSVNELHRVDIETRVRVLTDLADAGVVSEEYIAETLYLPPPPEPEPVPAALQGAQAAPEAPGTAPEAEEVPSRG